MGRWRRWCALAVGLLGGAALLRPLWEPLPHTFWLYGLLIMSCVAAALVFAALEARRGNRVFRLFFTAAGLLWGVFAVCCLLFRRLGGYTVQALVMAVQGDVSYLIPVLGTGLFLVCGCVGAHQVVRAAADDQTELELLAARDALLRENLRILEEGGTALAQARHDILGHLEILKTLSRQGEYEKLDEYLARITRQTREIAPLRAAAHPIINAILTQGAERAAKTGVKLRFRIDLPESLPFPDEDLAACLMNLQNNALEAAEKVPQGQPREAEITMRIRGRYLFIEGRNTCAQAPEPDGGGHFRSAKGAGRGYGLKIMESVARRYQGELSVQVRDGGFLVQTALLMPE